LGLPQGIFFALCDFWKKGGLMRCYFNGITLGDDPMKKSEGTVSFAIPDLGVVFRSRWVGDIYECQYAALLSLLQFIDTNKKAFQDQTIEIYTDSSVVAYHLTKGGQITKKLKASYRAVMQYKSKFAFKINWVPLRENPACHGLNDMPPLKPSIQLNFDVKGPNHKTIRRGGSLMI
jgi:hypothetical protein